MCGGIRLREINLNGIYFVPHVDMEKGVKKMHYDMIVIEDITNGIRQYGLIFAYLEILPGQFLQYNTIERIWEKYCFSKNSIYEIPLYRSLERHESYMCPFCEYITGLGYGDRKLIPIQDLYIMI